jgi:hypothetical protein
VVFATGTAPLSSWLPPQEASETRNTIESSDRRAFDLTVVMGETGCTSGAAADVASLACLEGREFHRSNADAP